MSNKIGEVIYVKGFAVGNHVMFNVPEKQDEELYVLLTDLITTAVAKIKSAKALDNGKLLVVFDDEGVEEEITLDWEPKVPRKMQSARLMCASAKDKAYLVCPSEYDIAFKNIKAREGNYYLEGYVNDELISTSPIQDVWVDDNGKRHALTRTGTDYIW